MAAASRAFKSGSGPPSLAATMISRTSLTTTWPFFCALASRPACFHCAPIDNAEVATGRPQNPNIKVQDCETARPEAFWCNSQLHMKLGFVTAIVPELSFADVL